MLPFTWQLTMQNNSHPTADEGAAKVRQDERMHVMGTADDVHRYWHEAKNGQQQHAVGNAPVHWTTFWKIRRIIETEEEVGILKLKEEVGTLKTKVEVDTLKPKEEVDTLKLKEEVDILKTKVEATRPYTDRPLQEKVKFYFEKY